MRGGGRGHVVIPVGRGLEARAFFRAFEPEHADAEQTVFLQAFAKAGRNRAEILADHNGLMPPRLERDQPQQVVERITQVRAVLRALAVGHEPETPQAENVIDTNARPRA